MKETRTINLNGIVFHIDNDAYLALSNYLHDIELRLPTDERKEVMQDMEARIAELFQSSMFARKVQVVDLDMVHKIESRMGAPSDFGENKRPVVKHRPSDDNQGCLRSLGIAAKVLLVLIALPVLGIICVVVFSLLLACIGVSAGIATALPMMMGIELFGGSGWLLALFVVCATMVIILPIVMIIKSIVMFARIHRGPDAKFWWTTVSTWFIALIITIVLLATGIRVDGQPANLQQLKSLAEMEHDDDDMPRTTTVLELPVFDKIEVNCPAKITLSQSVTQSVALRSNQPENVLTEVKNGVLHIAYKPQKNRYTVSELEIAVPAIQSVQATGAAQIETEGLFRQDALSIELAGASQADLNIQSNTLSIISLGASQVELEGATDSLYVDLTGASQLESNGLVAQNVHIVCAGASQAEVHAVKTLWAQAAGASQIEYKGNPRILQSLSVGASQIKKR